MADRNPCVAHRPFQIKIHEKPIFGRKVLCFSVQYKVNKVRMLRVKEFPIDREEHGYDLFKDP
jgi:hypothetical protein